jgi:hypothetical protein
MKDTDATASTVDFAVSGGCATNYTIEQQKFLSPQEEKKLHLKEKALRLQRALNGSNEKPKTPHHRHMFDWPFDRHFSGGKS